MASRVFVGFSSTDIDYFNLMKAWKKNENIDFDFIDLQISKEINSDNEQYIKGILRKKITNSGTFIQIIGQDTKRKHKYVRWEADIALEKNCRIIGVNINKLMSMDNTLTPAILKNTGSMFVPFNAKIVKHALDNYTQHEDDNWHYKTSVYDDLGIGHNGTKIY